MSNEKTTSQMNEAIARFMGGKRVMHPEQKYFPEDHFGYICHQWHWWSENNLKYHTSWDWLMPVVAELKERFKETHKTNPVQTQMHNEGINFQLRIVNISSAHLAAFHAIQWYNQQVQPELKFDYESREWERKNIQPASDEAINRMKERWKSEGKRECPDCGLWFKSEGRCPECNLMG